MFKKNEYIWICGYHSTKAALENKRREHKDLLITQSFYSKHNIFIDQLKTIVNIKIVAQDRIDQLFPKNTAHQNIALYTSNIKPTTVVEIFSNPKETSTILALDQVTDLGNIGAIMRSSAVFGLDGLVITKQNSPNKPTITKAASGTLEIIPLIQVANLSSTIKYAKDNGYWCYGMDERGGTPINKITFAQKTLIILGSEESGLRKLTQQNCDFLVKIPTANKVQSLNVASAAAITLYSRYSNL